MGARGCYGEIASIDLEVQTIPLKTAEDSQPSEAA
jgi:hypothetical protein